MSNAFIYAKHYSITDKEGVGILVPLQAKYVKIWAYKYKISKYHIGM